jgi:hypothetical protein
LPSRDDGRHTLGVLVATGVDGAWPRPLAFDASVRQAGYMPERDPSTASRPVIPGLGVLGCGLVVVAFATVPSIGVLSYPFYRTLAVAGAGAALAVAAVVVAVIARIGNHVDDVLNGLQNWDQP